MPILRWQYGFPLISSFQWYILHGGYQVVLSQSLNKLYRVLVLCISFTTLLMHSDLVTHHNIITTIPCLTSHHQHGCLNWASWKDSIPMIWLTWPLNWWPNCVFLCQKPHLFSFSCEQHLPPSPVLCPLSIYYPPPPVSPFRWTCIGYQ